MGSNSSCRSSDGRQWQSKPEIGMLRWLSLEALWEGLVGWMSLLQPLPSLLLVQPVSVRSVEWESGSCLRPLVKAGVFSYLTGLLRASNLGEDGNEGALKCGALKMIRCSVSGANSTVVFKRVSVLL